MEPSRISVKLAHSHCPHLAVLWFATLILVSGCGSGPSSTTSHSGPIPGESTKVAIQVSSEANDEFVQFRMEIEKIQLTNQAGVTTTIFNTPTAVNFIPANGNAVPFTTVSVPQDVYTSAAVAVSEPSFSNVSMDSQGEIYLNTDAYGYTPTPPVVNLAAPITVSGSTMGLILDLQAAKSGSYTGLQPHQTGYLINPTFDLTPFAIPAAATTPENGKCIGLAAEVTAVNASAGSLTVALPGNPTDGNPSLTVALNSATVFQGVASADKLAPGMLITMDAALQPDTSYSATRIEVDDATTTNIATGQLVEVDPSSSFISSTATQYEGSVLNQLGAGLGQPYAYNGATRFLTSAQFPNLSALPFHADFSAATLAAGQMVSIGSLTISLTGGQWTLPTSITLAPRPSMHRCRRSDQRRLHGVHGPAGPV